MRMLSTTMSIWARRDWDITSNQRLSVRYNANRFKGQNFENSGNASAAEHTGNSLVTTDSVAGTHTLVLGTRGVLETALGVDSR